MFHKLAQSLGRWTSSRRKTTAQIVPSDTNLTSHDMQTLLVELEKNWNRYRQNAKLDAKWEASMCSFDTETSQATEISWIEDEDERLVDVLQLCLDYPRHHVVVVEPKSEWV
ncbi:hypothetical protein Ae201684P_004759 [Aphanomyces euteiches]|uniref:Uncharacterized protein n=1 Tax=Aphanomyces euteiches TaxID=100861 RepID=A0A6G0XCC2_9STRA|nr:hypothetical protein Ae201684_006224 [Aphanomyces euteiches]KAH9069064.1 hypothetical protein Ae201684P_004759 [Aphanomyces euteiches]